MILVSHDQASEVIQPGKQALDFPAALVTPERTAVLALRLGPVAAMRSDQLNAQFAFKVPIQPVGVIGLVPNPPLRGPIKR